MKNKVFILMVIFGVLASFSYAQLFTEYFDGLTFPANFWTNIGVTRVNSTVTPPHSTPYCIEFNNSADQMITPQLTQPEYISFWHKVGQAGASFRVQHAPTVSGPWTDFLNSDYDPAITTYPIIPGADWTMSKITTSSYGDIFVRWIPTNNFRFYIDSVSMFLNPECVAPTLQPSNVQFSSIGQTFLSINWARGNGDYCIAFLHEGPGVPTPAVDGTVYNPSTNWTMPGDQLGTSGYYCIYRGTGNFVTVTNLQPFTNYWVVVYEFNCDGVSAHYLFPGAQNNATTLDPNVPVELSSFTATVNQQYYVVLNWSTESETEALGYDVFRYETNNVTDAYRINSAMIPATNTSTETHYSFVDKEAALGTWYYWLESKNLSGVSDFFGPISIVITDGTGSTVTPDLTSLSRLFPNPFNPSGTYLTGTYQLSKTDNILVAVYNIKGEKVRTIASGTKHAGSYPISWNGFNDNGKMCPTGVYYLILKTGDSITTRKVVMVK